ncbi:MAG: FAD/NAD(P)-binding protein, partial [Roseiflexaceae bacterium]
PHHRTLSLADGRQLQADHFILALGHAPIANPLQHWVPTPARVIAGYDWARIAHTISPEAPVIIIGTGLTMVDAVSTLWQHGHRTPITAISRHGHLPQTHVTYTPHPGFISTADYGASVRHLMRMVRREVARAHQQGQPWQAVIDALRPHTQSLWMGWSLADKRRFLRHVRAHWDIYRHRIAPQLATQLSDAQQRGQLTVVAGRITNYREDDDGVALSSTRRGSHTSHTHHAAWVINCTGPESDYTRITNPLVTALMQRGILNADPIRLGMDVDAHGHLIDSAEQVIPWLWSIGPPRKGYAWECIAIPDIRVQATQLADAIISAS